MICTHCGAENPDTNAFCTSCGAKLDAVIAEEPTQVIYESAPSKVASSGVAPVEAVPVEAVPVETAPVETVPTSTVPSESAPFGVAPSAEVPAAAPPSAEVPAAAPPSAGIPKWAPLAAIAAILVGVLLGIVVFMLNGEGKTNAATDTSSVQEVSSASAAEGLLESSTDNIATSQATATEDSASQAAVGEAAEETYIISTYDNYVAIFAASRTDDPYQITNLAIADLDSVTAAELGAGIRVASFEEASEKVNQLKEDVASVQQEREAQEAAAQEEARKKAEEEAAEQRAKEEAAAAEQKAKDDSAKAARMVESMEGWWRLPGTTSFVHIGDGAWDIYPADGSRINHFRTLTASDLVRCDNGLPGDFDGVPGYYIHSTDPASQGYFLRDDDFDADGQIDFIQHEDPEGNNHPRDLDIYRIDPPSWA